MRGGDDLLEMGFDPSFGVLIEPFVETDRLDPRETEIHRDFNSGWIELTVGVVGECGSMKSLTPSITVAKNAVLSLPEKFQGGTGVNLTPPPASLISPVQVAGIKSAIETTAQILGIAGYARIDIFFNTVDDRILVIEANSLPGLTPSTVIFQQAAAEVPPLDPVTFLEQLIDNKLASRRRDAA